MDDVKDISKKGSESHFLEDSTLRTNAFGHNISGQRAYARAERLAEAIHLVTNHISPLEPVRSFARRASLQLLTYLLVLRDELRSAESKLAQRSQALIRKLISYARILAIAGHVSTQNAEALIAALDELGVFLTTSQRSPLSDSVSFSKDDLVPTRSYPESGARERAQPRTVRDKPDEAKLSYRIDKARSRTEAIFGILKSQGELGIKDIAANFPEYSEKMIQRELKRLVLDGKVNKKGSKRWSMYALA